MKRNKNLVQEIKQTQIKNKMVTSVEIKRLRSGQATALLRSYSLRQIPFVFIAVTVLVPFFAWVVILRPVETARIGRSALRERVATRVEGRVGLVVGALKVA